MRLLHVITNQRYTAKVYQDYHWQEIKVKFYKDLEYLDAHTYFVSYNKYDKDNKEAAIQDALTVAIKELEALKENLQIQKT